MSPSTSEKEAILPVQLYCAEQVRAMDRLAIEKLHIPGLALMESAGRAAWELLLEKWPNTKTIAVFCGPGNNGGDGYVVARLAKEAGLEVQLYSTTESDCLKGDAATVCQHWLMFGGEIKKPSQFNEKSLDIIVDALLGTGLDRPVEGEIATVIDEINSVNVPVLALDIASGLHSDKGASLGAAVEAEATISFIALKQGLFTGAGAALSGEIYFDSLGVPETVLTSQQKSSERFVPYSPYLPKRKKSVHKGLFGHVLVAGGACGFSGAVQMAASAALRSGAGLVSVATRTEHASLLNLMRPELMVHGVNQKADLEPLLEKATVAVVGPGLGQAVWGQNLLAELVETTLPLVIDADALNLLAKESIKRGNWILTPHPGEAARLLGMTVKEVEADRFSAARKLQEKLGGVVILKGAGTVVFDGTELTINTTGNPGMASGGMGDVLSGIIAALLAQGLPLGKAARLGAWLHGKAADLSAVDGERGMLASDLLELLRKLVNR